MLFRSASRDELAVAIRKTKSFEKLTAQQLKATAITSLGKKTALELVLAAAEANKAKSEELKPKIISIHRADEEPAEMAVGQNNVVKIDKAKMIRNIEQREE